VQSPKQQAFESALHAWQSGAVDVECAAASLLLARAGELGLPRKQAIGMVADALPLRDAAVVINGASGQSLGSDILAHLRHLGALDNDTLGSLLEIVRKVGDFILNGQVGGKSARRGGQPSRQDLAEQIHTQAQQVAAALAQLSVPLSAPAAASLATSLDAVVQLAPPATTTPVDPNLWLTVNQAVLPQMREDYQRFLDQQPLGTTIDWAGGKLTRVAEGALFVDPEGQSLMLGPAYTVNFNDVARENPYIGAQWAQQYGYQMVGEPVDRRQGYHEGAFTEALPASVWSRTPEGRAMNDWITATYNSLAPAQVTQWNGMDVIRAGGSPGTLLIIDENHQVHAANIYTDKEWLLATDLFFAKLAQGNWSPAPST